MQLDNKSLLYILVCSISVYFYSSVVFWLALRARQNTARLDHDDLCRPNSRRLATSGLAYAPLPPSLYTPLGTHCALTVFYETCSVVYAINRW